jgi:cytochrome c553
METEEGMLMIIGTTIRPAPAARHAALRETWPGLATLLSALLWMALWLVLGLGGCAVEMQNVQPAREAARQEATPGSAYAGWRVFQDKCVACHGDSARGTERGPDLLPRVAGLGPRRFVDLVLRRYDWNLPAANAAAEGAVREALVDSVLMRRQGAVAMPAWQDEPSVNAHILDLYAYLAGRSEGTLGTGRPPRP